VSIQLLAAATKVQTGTSARKAVLMVLANYADQDGTCWPAQATIAEETELGERTVRRALAELEADGWITREHRLGRVGRTSDRYRLHLNRAVDNPGKQPATQAGSPQSNRPHRPDQPATQAEPTGHSGQGTISEPSMNQPSPVSHDRPRSNRTGDNASKQTPTIDPRIPLALDIIHRRINPRSQRPAGHAVRSRHGPTLTRHAATWPHARPEQLAALTLGDPIQTAALGPRQEQPA
jgi:hypothetical protein